jgi:hypothetical protein
MIGIYQYGKKSVKRKLAEREARREFFFDSIGDETYLDLIRDKIEFLIDEGYKYSEQLDIINRGSGRNIPYKVYTKFVKTEVLQDPSLLFQQRGGGFQQGGYYPPFPPQFAYPQQQQPVVEEKAPVVEKRVEEPVVEEKTSEPASESDSGGFTLNLKRNTTSSKKSDEPVVAPKKNVGGTPIKRKKPQNVKVEKTVFHHEAMPDINELY